MAVRKPPMIKALPSERIPNSLDIARKNAKGARISDAIQQLYEKYSYDEIVCENLAGNNYTSTEILEKLALHENPKIRFKVAGKSDKINDEDVLDKLASDQYQQICHEVARTTTSTRILEKLALHKDPNIRLKVAGRSDKINDEHVLDKLAFDTYPEIRYCVARTTTNDTTMRKIFVSNKHHKDLQKLCIKRITDMNMVEQLVFLKKPESMVPMFVDNIMDNQNLNYRICLLVLKYVKLDDLSDEQTDLIIQHIDEHEESSKEILDIISKE